jgi:hypothetical protein
MKRTLSLTAVLILLLASGLVHGLWTERWGTSMLLQDAAARVDAIPLQVGPWRGRAEHADPETFEQAGAHAYWLRQYTHTESRFSPITAVLMCGRAGRMAVHTPEVCYGGAGFDMVHGRRHLGIAPEASEAGQFWSARFAKDKGVVRELLLYWSWNDGRGWQAPDSPRWHFRGAAYLYKLYIVREIADSTAPDDNPAADFLRYFLPAAQETLFASTPATEPRP